jgi:hypothetical protein
MELAAEDPVRQEDTWDHQLFPRQPIPDLYGSFEGGDCCLNKLRWCYVVCRLMCVLVCARE